MKEKWISLFFVACASLCALFFIIKQNVNAAILCLSILFTLTNFFRSRTFKEQGYVKEAKWMRGMAIFFGIASILILIMIIK